MFKSIHHGHVEGELASNLSPRPHKDLSSHGQLLPQRTQQPVSERVDRSTYADLQEKLAPSLGD